jgi:uncharacterized repeat protein (TIGR01451 family)
MIKGTVKFIAAAVIACALHAPAFAQTNCVELKTTGEVEKEVVNAKGEKSKVLVAAADTKVIPGTEVIWTVTAKNVCKEASDKVVITNPVPEHMTLVPGSVFGAGADVTYSVDGKTFAPAGQLTVSENGVARAARAEEYRHVRWVFKNPIPGGSSAFGRFRATLN